MTTIEEVKKVKDEFEAGVAATLVTRTDLTLEEIAVMHGGISPRQVRSIMGRRGIRRRPGRKPGVSLKKETT